MIPRTIGSRSQRCRAIADTIGRVTCAISPSGLRTATAQFDGLRIITPSRTACPPTVMVELAAPRLAGALEAALEALDPAARIHELVLARVERVAVRADLHVQLGLRGARLERVPAGAGHVREHVVGMDAGLHGPARIAAAVCGATLPPETTAATVRPGSRSTLPARSAAAVAAPASSQASFIRPYTNRNAPASSSSVTSTDSTPSSAQTETQLGPA